MGWASNLRVPPVVQRTVHLGLRWTVADETFYLDASYGRQMASGRARLVTLGFKFAF